MRLMYKNVIKQRTVNLALCHATCLHLTSSNDQRLMPGMITPLSSKYMTSGYHHGRLITNWWERAYRICRLGYCSKQYPNATLSYLLIIYCIVTTVLR